MRDRVNTKEKFLLIISATQYEQRIEFSVKPPESDFYFAFVSV